VTEGAKVATQEEIRGMIEVSKPRTKVLILFLKDTGLNLSDTSTLKLRNLGFDSVNEIFEAESPISLITNGKKTQMPVVTFVDREALDAIKTTL
jgi:hypothetical protein